MEKITVTATNSKRRHSFLPIGRSVFLMLLPQLLLLALLLFLFVLLFRVCIANKRGKEASGLLVGYLRQLEQRFADGAPIDPLAERTELEPLLNSVKVWNTNVKISKNLMLRFRFVRSYNFVSEWLVATAPEDIVQWKLLDTLMSDFYETYLAGKVPAAGAATAAGMLQSANQRTG